MVKKIFQVSVGANSGNFSSSMYAVRPSDGILTLKTVRIEFASAVAAASHPVIEFVIDNGRLNVNNNLPHASHLLLYVSTDVKTTIYNPNVQVSLTGDIPVGAAYNVYDSPLDVSSSGVVPLSFTDCSRIDLTFEYDE